MAAKKTTLSNALLNAVLTGAAYTSPSARYIALFTTAPDAGAGGTEVTGGAYALTAGNQLYYGDLGTEKLVDIGDQLNFAVGAITVTES
jgi:hypothetical protein